MKRNILSFLIIMLCFSVMTVATLSVAATNGDEGETSSIQESFEEVSSSQDASSSESSSEESSSFESSSEEENNSSNESSSENTDSASSDESSSGEGIDSSDSSSQETESDGEGEEDTSSSSTSSKKPITSVGAGGGSTFVDETDPNVSLPQVTSKVESPEDSDTQSNVSGFENEDLENLEFDEGKTTSMANQIYKFIWIPIVIALLCIGALIYVNLAFRKRFGEVKSSTGKKTVNRRTNTKHRR